MADMQVGQLCIRNIGKELHPVDSLTCLDKYKHPRRGMEVVSSLRLMTSLNKGRQNAIQHTLVRGTNVHNITYFGTNSVPLLGLKWDWEVDVPEWSGRYFSRIFMENIRFPGNGIWERSPLI